MPRKIRVEFPGVIYQVMSRGDRHEDIFLDDVDRDDLSESGLTGSCVLLDAQPLPPGHGDAHGESGRRHALALERLHRSVKSPS